MRQRFPTFQNIWRELCPMVNTKSSSNPEVEGGAEVAALFLFAPRSLRSSHHSGAWDSRCSSCYLQSGLDLIVLELS